MLHRSVMGVALGRELAQGEFVCHRDDDKRNNRPETFYVGDRKCNAAGSLRNGQHPTGDRHPFAKLSGCLRGASDGAQLGCRPDAGAG
jgi:hypothetical protein